MRASHVLAVMALPALVACGDGVGTLGAGPGGTRAPAWTWVSGSSSVNQLGVYGTQGTASPSNVPGARDFSVSWIDAAGDFWLFGGRGLDGAGSIGVLNDLWRFDGTNWAWISGSSTACQSGF